LIEVRNDVDVVGRMIDEPGGRGPQTARCVKIPFREESDSHLRVEYCQPA